MRTFNLPRRGESRFRGVTSRGRRGAAAAALTLVLLGCGGGTGAPATVTPTQGGATPAGVPTSAATSAATAATADVDSCKLLTPAEVSAAYGYAVGAGVPSADELYAYCNYPSADGREKAMIFVTRSSAAAGYFQTVKVNDGHAVSGVGDEAFWSTSSFLPGLYFMKGGTMAYISSSRSGSGPLSEDALIPLGKLLASRM